MFIFFFFFSSRRRHTRLTCDWSSDVCSSDLENDQIHFFYHFQEGRSTGTTNGALQHAMLVAGRPILFATLINASGFLALVLSDLPPMREFGIVASSAFVLALIADFTALPGALWILSKYDRGAVNS